MSEINRDQIKTALKVYEDTISPKRCAVCVLATSLKGLCEPLLFKSTLALINEQETEYNELYELCESYRREIGEARAATAREIFADIEMLLKRYIFPVAKMGYIEIEKEPFLCIEPKDFYELKKKYTEAEEEWRAAK